MSETRRNLSCLIMFLFSTLFLSWMTVGAFNLDTQFPLVFRGAEGSSFGYTVAVSLKADRYVVLVSAPTANSSVETSAYKPGGLFWCDINSTLCADVFGKSSKRLLFTPSTAFRMWLGVTLEVVPDLRQPLNGILEVVCAHRAVRGPTSVNGLCCVLRQNFTLAGNDILKPLEYYDKQYVYDDADSVYRSYHNNGQVGMSAAFSKDGSHLIVGAPGIFEGMGSVFYYNGITSSYEVSRGRSVKKPPTGEKHGYFGYSITSGHFLDIGVDQYAVGAPRGESHGKVYIISTSDSSEISTLQSEKGSEVGEYFGASVLGVNLNGDSFTDLVVGSPLYAHELGCDEGKVTVYISDGKVLNFHFNLFGDGKSDARFGSSIADIGDLNKDGFEDFAVGAPYEDGKGAIYIYHGSESGVIAQYTQKIEAVQVHPNLAGFGIHISRGVDIDFNGYPDIVVGSYLSSNAVLLRALPVIEVSPEVHFNPAQIKFDKAECVYSGKNLPCVYVDCCLIYRGQHVPASLDFHCTLVEKDENPRGFFLPYRPKNAAVEMDFSLKNDTPVCLTKQFFLQSDIKDIVTPIPMHFSCELAASTAPNDTFDKAYPVVSPYSVRNVSSQIPFHNGCSNDDICYSDLIIDVELHGEAMNGVITLGNVSSIHMDIAVRNEGEPAYSSELLIFIPPDVPIINKDFCDSRSQLEKNIIACYLGNPLFKDKQVNIRIKLDTTKISPHTKFIEIFLEASTNSSETNPIDNQLNVSLEVKKTSDMHVRGTPSHYLILNHEEQEMSSQITHKFTVRNYGPSPLHTIDILLQVPHVVLTSAGRKPFLHLKEIQTDGMSDNILPAACMNASQDIEMFLKTASRPEEAGWENDTVNHNESTPSSNSIKKRSVTESSTEGGLIIASTEMELNIDSREEKRRFQIIISKRESGVTESHHIYVNPLTYNDVWETSFLSCAIVDFDASETSTTVSSGRSASCKHENIECLTIQCSASPFSDARKFAEIAVAFKMNYTTLNDYFGRWHQIEFLSTGSISISDPDVFLLPYHSDVTSVRTVLYNDAPSPIEIPHWLFSVGAFLGSMLLFQIIIILIKVGFFRRKEKEILERLEKSLTESSTDEDLLINPSDDSSAEDE